MISGNLKREIKEKYENIKGVLVKIKSVEVNLKSKVPWSYIY